MTFGPNPLPALETGFPPVTLLLAAEVAARPDVAALVGGKAASLVRLVAAGLPVPPAGAVTTVAYALTLASLPARLGDEAVQQALLTTPLEPAIERAIADLYRQLGGGLVAVRSSGVAEDLAAASFAGMYDTFLHIEGENAVIEAVRKCWASAYSERVLSYAAIKGIPREAMAMGVVLQRMVPADVAGVLFTLDPTSGREEHMRAEACWGLGELLVGGLVTPDGYLLDRDGGPVVDQRVAPQDVMLARGAAGGVVEVPVPLERQHVPKLDAARLAELTALGRKIQALHGCPQDIEWAIVDGKLWLLQARPITHVSYAGIEGEWTTADFKDGGVAASVCSPYMWSLYDYIWQWSMPHYLRKIKLLRHDKPIVWGRVFYGRPYWNVGEVKHCLHRVPGFNERHFDRDLGIEGAYEGDGVVIPTNFRTILGALPVLFALEKDYKTCLARDKAFLDRFEALVEGYATDPSTLGREALAARYRRLVIDDYFTAEGNYFLTIFNTSNARLDFKVELDKANKGLAEPLSLLALLGGLANVRHLDPLADLWHLADKARANEALRTTLATTPVDELEEAIQSRHAAFWREIAAFLHLYRHHGVAELDITVPRWDEDPTFVLQTLQAYMTDQEFSREPGSAAGRQQIAYARERERAHRVFRSRGPLGSWRARGFFGKLELLRTYAWWREEMRDRSSRVYALIRRETLAVAGWLARDGALERREDVWQLTFREVLEAIDGDLDPARSRALVTKRREAGDGYRRFTNPNELGRRFKVGAHDKAVLVDGAHVGIACSPGKVKAIARVVPTIHDGARLKPGEILVTKFTDPGWTPLFARIAGVVTETGGLLSHAAVIAREYGIPAVLAVSGATTAIVDGAWVELDGNAGTIRPLPDPDPISGV